MDEIFSNHRFCHRCLKYSTNNGVRYDHWHQNEKCRHVFCEMCNFWVFEDEKCFVEPCPELNGKQTNHEGENNEEEARKFLRNGANKTLEEIKIGSFSSLRKKMISTEDSKKPECPQDKSIGLVYLRRFNYYGINDVRASYRRLVESMTFFELKEDLKDLENEIETEIRALVSYNIYDFIKNNPRFIEDKIETGVIRIRNRRLCQINNEISRIGKIYKKSLFGSTLKAYLAKFKPTTGSFKTYLLKMQVQVDEEREVETPNMFDLQSVNKRNAMKVLWAKSKEMMKKSHEMFAKLKKQDLEFISSLFVTFKKVTHKKNYTSKDKSVFEFTDKHHKNRLLIYKSENHIVGAWTKKKVETCHYYTDTIGAFLFSLNYHRVYRLRKDFIDFALDGPNFGSDIYPSDIYVDYETLAGESLLHSYETVDYVNGEKISRDEKDNLLFGKKAFNVETVDVFQFEY